MFRGAIRLDLRLLRVSRQVARLWLSVALLGGLSQVAAQQTRYSNFEHLDFLVQPFDLEGREALGIWIYAEPSPDESGAYVHRDAPGEGVTDLDDIARAAVLYLRGYELGLLPEEGLESARGLLETTLALQAEDGEFYNFVFADGSINALGRTSRKSASFWAARGLWALAEGYRIFKDRDPEFAADLKAGFLAGLEPFNAKMAPSFGSFDTIFSLEVPQWLPDNGADITSILALALTRFLEVEENAEARNLLAMSAEGLARFQYGPPGDYPFLAHPSFARDPFVWHAWGSRQTQALARAFGVSPEQGDWLESAEAEAGHFFVHLLAADGPLEGMAPALDTYAQIAYGMESIASGYFALADVTGKEVYEELGGLTTSWLFGNNALRQSMYQAQSGRTFDGLERGIINRNSGAESTISGLLALIEAETSAAAREMLDYRWLASTPELILEVETGRDFGQSPPTEVDGRASGQLTAVLNEGASLTASLEVEQPGAYIAYGLYRAEPWQSEVEVFLGSRSLGRLSTGPVERSHYRMAALGRVELESGTQRLTVTHLAGRPVRFDALLFRPVVMQKIYGKPGERLLLLKSWADAEVDVTTFARDGQAEARTFDRLANLVETRSLAAGQSLRLPPYGFALLNWQSDAPLPALQEPGRSVGERFVVDSRAAEGDFVLLELAALYNNDGFSSPAEPLKGNFDNHSGVLGASYPAERSPDPGTVFSAGEAPFLFPPTDADANNIALLGQRLDLAPARYAALYLLGASEQGNYRAELKLHYADGGSETLDLGLSDWCQQPRYGEAVALAFSQRRGASGNTEPIACKIFVQRLALDPERELVGMTLPDRETMHIFAMTLEMAP